MTVTISLQQKTTHHADSIALKTPTVQTTHLQTIKCMIYGLTETSIRPVQVDCDIAKTTSCDKKAGTNN